MRFESIPLKRCHDPPESCYRTQKVIEILSDPSSAGQGGRADEPLLLVRNLAADETDAIFGDFRPEYFGQVPHDGTWSPMPGGFNCWVETYHRTVLGGTRPVLVTVHVSAVLLRCLSLLRLCLLPLWSPSVLAVAGAAATVDAGVRRRTPRNAARML